MARVLVAVSLLVWALLAVSGVSGYLGIRGQGAPGYPNGAQAIMYLAIPLGMTLGCAIFLAFGWRIRPHLLVGIWTVISLVAILPYLILSRGGVKRIPACGRRSSEKGRSQCPEESLR